MALAENIPTLMAGRVIVGLAIGTSSMIEPVYLSEVSPVKVRGTIVSVYVVSITVGQLTASLVALALDRSWRWMLGLAAFPAAIQGLCLLFMPESQRWLAKTDNWSECDKSLNRVYDAEGAKI